MRVLACLACIAAAHAGSPACETDRKNAAEESLLAFAHPTEAQAISIKLINYEEVSTARQDELKTIISNTLKAVAPDGSTVTVEWEDKLENEHTPESCEATDLIPIGAAGTKNIHVFDPEFNSDNCKYSFAGVA